MIVNIDGEVEPVSLPRRHQNPPQRYTHVELMNRYAELQRLHLQALEDKESIYRHAWSVDRLAYSLEQLVEAQRAEIARLSEAGRYAVYGKPQLSPVDDYTDEAYTDGEAMH